MKQNKIVVILHNEENLLYVGDSVADALQQMWYDDESQDRDGLCFTVCDMAEGTEKKYQYISVMFHYCFDHGRISVEELLDECKVV